MSKATRPIDAAVAIADTIAEGSIWSGGVCTFVGATAERRSKNMVVYRSLGGSLYEGTAGIARFLGHAYYHIGKEHYLEVARGALAHAIKTETGDGLYSGRIGVALTCAELGLLFSDESLMQKSLEIASEVSGENVEPSYTGWDLLAGVAGTVLGLSLLGSILKEPKLIGLAESLAARIVDSATKRAEGLSWKSPVGEDERDHLCGFAHGASGIALSLEVLDRVKRNGDWAALADEARRYDTAGFDSASGGWMDLRTPDGERSGQHYWCHGAVGIGVDRIWSIPGRPQPVLLAEASAAVLGIENWVKHILDGPHGPGSEFGANTSVCHGVFGAVDVLLDAAVIGREPRLADLGREVADFCIQGYKAIGHWQSGLPDGAPTPGFFLGSAGIGHVCLRLSDGASTPPAGLPPLADRILGMSG